MLISHRQVHKDVLDHDRLSGVAVFDAAILVTLLVRTPQDFALDQTRAMIMALALRADFQTTSSADKLATPISVKISDVRAIEPPTSMPRQASSITIASKPSRRA